MMLKFVSILLIVCFFHSIAFATDICIPSEQAKKVVQELEQKRILEKENQTLYEEIELLKKQNALLKEQVEQLKEINKLQENKYKLCESERKKNFLEKLGIETGSLVIGAIIGVLILLAK